MKWLAPLRLNMVRLLRLSNEGLMLRPDILIESV